MKIKIFLNIFKYFIFFNFSNHFFQKIIALLNLLFLLFNFQISKKRFKNMFFKLIILFKLKYNFF